LTVALVRLSKPKTVSFQVKKVGKEIKVNLSNSEMSFFDKLYQFSQQERR